MRKVTFVYACILVLIIVAADTGCARPFFRTMQRLGSDKLGHFGLFGLLAFMLGVSFVQGRGLVLPSSLALMVFVTVEECSQLFLVNRAADPWDLVADFIGILFFDYLAQRWAERQRQLGELVVD